MKLKASKSIIIKNSYRILSVGYCDLQYLLKAQEPFSYCSGTMGWNCDNYEIITQKHRLIISTGYSPIVDHNINKNILKNKYDIIDKYEQKARKIVNKYGSWDETKKKLNKLVEKFVDEICESEN